MMKQNITAMLKYWLIGLVAISAFPSLALAEASAGRFQFVSGDVRILDNAGRERVATKGGNINEGDTIVTVGGASAQVSMVDEGFIAIRPDTRLKIETYKYNGREDGAEKGLFSLLRGGFRAITGVIGRTNKDNYQIKTPAATIGIRGTDHEPMFIPPPLPGEIAIGKPGAYDKVNLGQAYIQTPQGIANIGPNQIGYVAGMGAKPTLLPVLPDFYKTTPQPGSKDSKEEKKEEKKQQADAKQQKQDAKPEGKAEGKEGKEASGQKEGGKGEKTAGPASGDKGAAPAGKEGGSGTRTAGTASGSGSGSGTPATAENGKTGAQPAGGSAAAPANSQPGGTRLGVAGGAPTPGMPAPMSGGAPMAGDASAPGMAGGGVPGMAGGAPTTPGMAPATGMAGGMAPLPSNYAFNVGSSSLMGGPMPTMPGSMPGGTMMAGGTYAPTAPGGYMPGTAPAPGAYSGTTGGMMPGMTMPAVMVMPTTYMPATNTYITPVNIGGYDASGNYYNFTTNATTSAAGTTVTIGNYTLAGSYGPALTAFTNWESGCWGGTCGVLGLNNRTAGIEGPLARDTSGRLVGAAEGYNTSYPKAILVDPAASVGDVVQTSGYGITLGRWTTANLSFSNFSTSSTGSSSGANVASPNGMHWVTGPTTSAIPMTLTGTALYTVMASTPPTDQSGITGTLNANAGDTFLDLDFSKQAITNMKITASVNNRLWVASGSNIAMNGGSDGFWATTGGATGHALTVTMSDGNDSSTYNGGGGSGSKFTYGSVNGNLFGTTVQGAGAVYALGAYDTYSPYTAAMPHFYSVTGAVAYSTGTAYSYGNHRAVLFSQPSLTRDAAFAAPMPSYPSDVLTPASASLTPVGANTVVAGDSLTKFQAEYVREESYSCGASCTNYNYNHYPAVITLTGTPAESGYDAATTFHWGRWNAGTMAVTDTAASAATITTANNLTDSNSLHYLFSDAKSTVDLPLTGAFTYATIAGSTTPTMSDGSTGTLNSANLTADFSAMRITALNLNVSVTAGASSGMQWAASKAGEIVLQKPGYFEASTSAGNLAVTCTNGGSGCSAGNFNAGKVQGIFASSTTPTAVGISYALNNRNIQAEAGKTVSGVAVLK